MAQALLILNIIIQERSVNESQVSTISLVAITHNGRRCQMIRWLSRIIHNHVSQKS